MKLDREAVRAANRLEDIIPALTGEQVQEIGPERLTRGTFHDDEHPSLRVNVRRIAERRPSRFWSRRAIAPRRCECCGALGASRWRDGTNRHLACRLARERRGGAA